MIVHLIVAMSRDGYIAREGIQSTMEWTSTEDKNWFTEKTKEIGCVIMGRKTWDTIGKVLPERTSIVLTHHPEKYTSEEHLQFCTGEPKDILADLSAKGIRECAVIGGRDVYQQFLDAQLVDYAYVTIEPIDLKDGLPFSELLECPQLQKTTMIALNDSGTMLYGYTCKTN